MDTSGGSIYVDLPLNPANNTQVSIVDSEGYFHLYPIYLRPAPDGDNTTGVTINGIGNDAFALTKRYGVYTLLYSDTKNAWFFIDNQESKNFNKGEFIQCAGLVAQDPTLNCVAGDVPALYSDEVDPPVYVIQDNRCYLQFTDNTALYSNPSLSDNLGLKAVFNDPRCSNLEHTPVSGGTFGFEQQESLDRNNFANLLLTEFDASILTAINVGVTASTSEIDTLRDFNNRVAYAIRFGFWIQVIQLELLIKSTVTLESRQQYYAQIVNLAITNFPLAGFDSEIFDNIDWLNDPL